jgi:hypothetical protein
MPGRQELPSTIERSSERARTTWIAAHEAAVEQYGEGERAYRTAYDALKHGFEKVGDHWEAKSENGSSGRQAPWTGTAARHGGPTAGGVDANAPRAHLLGVARGLDISGRSTMRKRELVEAIERESRRRTAQARA